MSGRDSLLFNRPNWWRLYGAVATVGLMALGCLAAATWMLLFREEAEPFIRAYLVRPRRWQTFGETGYTLYLGAILILGLVLSASAVWFARAIPTSERRLDDRLARQLEEEASRNTRGLD